MKVKRSVVAKHHRDLLDELYKEVDAEDAKKPIRALL
jgi:hypothetical protein